MKKILSMLIAMMFVVSFSIAQTPQKAVKDTTKTEKTCTHKEKNAKKACKHEEKKGCCKDKAKCDKKKELK